jgi:hypothetical protein
MTRIRLNLPGLRRGDKTLAVFLEIALIRKRQCLPRGLDDLKRLSRRRVALRVKVIGFRCGDSGRRKGKGDKLWQMFE